VRHGEESWALTNTLLREYAPAPQTRSKEVCEADLRCRAAANVDRRPVDYSSGGTRCNHGAP
jgi:hypothetical protein